ncbi:hypothetical protein, partial [Bordetella bronchiseptica]
MTTQNNAAKAAQNAVEWATNPGAVENFPATARAHINGLASLLLSKLRAPVADERALPPMPKPAVLWHSDFTNQTYYGYTADHMRAYARTALASAPVAGEARPVIHQHGFAADNQRLRA